MLGVENLKNIIVNAPHASDYIPPEIRGTLLLSDEEIGKEHELLVDIWADKFFSGLAGVTIHSAEVSRLVCDTERFDDDTQEPMAAVGRGVIYTKTADGRSLRELSAGEREAILGKYYRPYHAKLTSLVADERTRSGSVLIIDSHSFWHCDEHWLSCPVDLCIGVDGYHTPGDLVEATKRVGGAYFRSIEINHPYSGSLVPMQFYQKDKNVFSIMIEINRKSYAKQSGGLERMQEFCHKLVEEYRALGY
jgi:N-formylglutamate amidohydrolase